jgi:hypothetical protein
MFLGPGRPVFQMKEQKSEQAKAELDALRPGHSQTLRSRTNGGDILGEEAVEAFASASNHCGSHGRARIKLVWINKRPSV